MTTEKKLSPSRALGIKVLFAAMSILRDNEKEMPMRELMERIGKVVELDDWALERYEKTGYIRWQSILHFHSIDSVKSGYLVKKKAVWYLTPEGEEALKLGPEGFFEASVEGYRKWKSEQPVTNSEDELLEIVESTETAMDFSEIEQIALEGMERYLNHKNPYEFQDLVAALLRGMGYHTPFIAPKGKDGGIDVMAYRDPFGTESPRIRAQVKHRQSSASVQEVRQLMGLLQKEGDVGIFVSTGGFTPDARAEARSSNVHVELINQNRFINLWQEFYDKMTDDDKSLMPLTPIYFLKHE